MTGKTNTGGGVTLNFRVLNGTSAPASPKENDIWVNTSATITEYILSATQPSTPSNGMLWVRLGAVSNTPFSAAKRNPVMVYPVYAKLYTNSAWSAADAKIRQSNAWKTLGGLTLYYSGDEYTEITGGWSRAGYTGSDYTIYKNSNAIGTLSFENASIGIGPELSVDCTPFSTIRITVETAAGATTGYLCVCTQRDDTFTTIPSSAVKTLNLQSTGEYTLDISDLTGNFYLRVTGYGTSASACKIMISRLSLE